MILTRFICVLSMVMFLPGYFYGQTDEEILAKANEFVVKLTSQEYFEQLDITRGPSELNWLVIEDSSSVKTYSIIYRLNEQYNTYNMHVINEVGGLGPAGIFIELDENMELVEGGLSYRSIAQSQLQAYHRFKQADILSRKAAEKLADKHFSRNFKKPYGNYLLIYDSRTDSLVWRFEKFKGFKNYTLEEVYINAETGALYQKKSLPFRRSFKEALFRYRSV